ncbi:YeeE/YedE family protein [Magnetospirillum sp. LM-5]|uniref:YeeE/YedE family protein n=1 Tax=Magnetospirillum sp. LM-5 TaxID=2681466 RepID=UPI0035305093
MTVSELPISTIVGLGAFVTGLIFGAVANRTHFCTMGALSDIVFMGDWKRFRSWMLALAIGLIGTQAMQSAGMIDLSKSIYLQGAIGWAGAVIGGLLFGFGMTMAGGCGNKTLVRLGAGNLKSLVTFMVIALFAYMTLKGFIGLARVQMDSLTAIAVAGKAANQGIPALLAMIGIPASVAQWGTVAVIGGGLLVFCLKDGEFRSSPADLFGGLVIGLLIVAGWWVTGVLGNDEFEPTAIASFTFVAPIGDTMQYLMTFTGSTINFGIAAVGGVIVGSFLAAIASKTFAFEAFAGTEDMGRHLIGAAMMGVGGVLSMGCTIGQGLTGMSTLSITSLIALGSVIFGGVWGLKYMEEGEVGAALKAVFARG